jgi:hypothetical protein
MGSLRNDILMNVEEHGVENETIATQAVNKKTESDSVVNKARAAAPVPHRMNARRWLRQKGMGNCNY